MKIEREDLAAALSVVKPALATKDPLMQLLCVWFTGDRLCAYNNVIGIDVPLKSDFKGAIQGAAFAAMVGASMAKQADLSTDKDSIVLKMGGSRSRFALIPASQAVWQFPKLPKKSIELGEDFCTALDRIMLCADPAVGITLLSNGHDLDMYSTNDRSLAWDKIDCPAGFPEIRVEVPPAFCEQVLSLCKEGGKLYLDKDFVVAVSDSGARVFSKLMESQKPLDYEQALALNLPKGYRKQKAAIPDKLDAALDRVLIMFTGGDIAKAHHSIGGNKLVLTMQNSLGSLREEMPFEAPHLVEISLDVTMLKKGIAKAKDILFTEDAAIMTWGGSGAYIIAALA